MAFNKNGNVTASKFSSTVLLEDMEIKALSDGSVWAKVFEHNNRAGTVLFTSIAEVLNTQTVDKYSRLYLLNSMKAADGKLELMLEYPDEVAGKYNRWKQTNAPQDEFVENTSAGDGKVTGYEAIHIDWSGYYWGGIARQSSSTTSVSYTYLDGSVGHANWWYAIGSFTKYSIGIPGPSVGIAQRAQLWARIDTVNPATASLSKNKTMLASDFYEV